MDVRVQVFPSTRDAAADASAFVMSTAEQFGLSDSIREALLLVVGEAVANAAGHGNRLDPKKQVVVECAKGDGEVRLCVEDEGPGVPVERLEHAQLPNDPFDTSGRGLFIMKSLADRVWLESSGRRLCMMWREVDDAPSS
ncbi:MAG: ATP-binding protein [Rhodothermales bacterium]